MLPEKSAFIIGVIVHYYIRAGDKHDSTPLCFRRTPETKLSSASERLHDEEEENVENSILFPHSYIFYF